MTALFEFLRQQPEKRSRRPLKKQEPATSGTERLHAANPIPDMIRRSPPCVRRSMTSAGFLRRTPAASLSTSSSGGQGSPVAGARVR